MLNNLFISNSRVQNINSNLYMTCQACVFVVNRECGLGSNSLTSGRLPCLESIVWYFSPRCSLVVVPPASQDFWLSCSTSLLHNIWNGGPHSLELFLGFFGWDLRPWVNPDTALLLVYPVVLFLYWACFLKKNNNNCSHCQNNIAIVNRERKKKAKS